MAAAAITNCYSVTLDHARSLLHGRKSLLKFHVENHTFGHKSAIIAYICTEFDTEAENGPPFRNQSKGDINSANIEQTRTKFDRDAHSQVLKAETLSTKQTTQGYKFFSKLQI